jgi:pantoate--beta-alanine ligase
MIILDTPTAMRAWSLQQRAHGKSVGCVPTMGALHEGHLSLVQASVEACDMTVLTLFVNPAQFAPHEDFDQYPRTFESDCAKCETAGVDAIYAPKVSSMYPEHYATYVEVERLQEGLCSTTRPHFFRGVATVVTKLFNATLPDKAFFGLKDGQQFTVIKRMARDLDMGIEVIGLPTVREDDGLAMSSRNQYLSADERTRALCISQALFQADAMVDGDEMTPITTVNGPVMLAIAAKLGHTRLIDNIRFEASASPSKDPVPEGSLSC